MAISRVLLTFFAPAALTILHYTSLSAVACSISAMSLESNYHAAASGAGYSASPMSAGPQAAASPYGKSGAGVGDVNDLEFSLDPGTTPGSVTVTLTNKNPTQHYSFLAWDTPFDTTSINSGVIHIRDASNQKELQSPMMKLRRLLPPPTEAIIDVPPGKAFAGTLALDSPWIPKNDVKQSYLVRAVGSFRAVYPKPAKQVSTDELSNELASGVLKGDFMTNEVTVQL